MPVRASIVIAVVIALAGGGAFVLDRRADERRGPGVTATQAPVRVGAGGDREAVLLAHVLADLLRAHDIPVEIVSLGHARDVRQALELREVDVAPSYTGAVWLDDLKWADPPGDVVSSYERVAAADRRRGLIWLGASQANATFAFVVAGPPSRGAVLDGIDDLALAVSTDPSARLCVDPDVAGRPDGLAEIARIYGFRDEVLAEQILAVPPEEAVIGVTHGGCIAGLSTATDGRSWVAGLRPLHDRRGTFPAFAVGAVATERLVEERAEVVAALEAFQELTTEMLASWNGRLVLGEPLEVVSEEAGELLRGIRSGRTVTEAL